jgi:hypothetical protein
MQRYGDNITFSRRHLESLKIQLQENIEVHFMSTKLDRNGRNYYFISLGRPRYPNPRLQAYYNNDRLLHPRAHRLEAHHHLIIERLCHERRDAENFQIPPALIDKHEVNDNELALVIEEDLNELAHNEQHQADVPVRVERDEHHVDDHQNNHLIDEIVSEEEASDNKEGDEYQLTPQEQLINYALTVDVEGTAAHGFRLAQSGQDAVILNDKKQLDGHSRMLIVVYAINSMDYKNPMHSNTTRRTIALAAATLMSYDKGYKKVLGKTRLEEWIKQLEQSARVSGCIRGLNSKHKGKQTCYIDSTNAVDETYLKRLYRYASSLHGDVATFKELADAMNAKENVLPEHKKPMHLSQGQVKHWFNSKKGKSYSIKEKPFLSEEQKEGRVRRAQRTQELKRRGAIITYLDEKWFYILSWRHRLKYLPREDFEPEGWDQLKVRKVISQ